MGRMLAWALRRRCPHCGTGGLFTGWFTMVEHCPGCGWRFERDDSGFALGAMAVNIMVTEAVFGVLLVVGIAATLPDVPVLRLTMLAVAVNVVVPVVFYPWSKTVWAAIDLRMRPLEDRDRRPGR